MKKIYDVRDMNVERHIKMFDAFFDIFWILIVHYCNGRFWIISVWNVVQVINCRWFTSISELLEGFEQDKTNIYSFLK